MLLFTAGLIIGLGVLVWSADRFVDGAVATARNQGMSPMLIGLTIVAFGTSAPEMIVSATAALDGAAGLAIGNAIGSNIANIGLVLGTTALIATIPVKPMVVKREFPILLTTTAITALLLIDGHLGQIDGVILFGMLALSLYFLSRNHIEAPELTEEVDEMPAMNTGKALFTLCIGLILLLASSKLLVWSATGIAREFGVSELIIGLTIVAIGTSLPELAASISSALKGHHDIALGNVIGSNLFNLLAVLPFPGLINPGPIESSVLLRDYSTMFLLTGILAYLAYHAQRKQAISRLSGAFFLVGYTVYLAILYINATQ